MPIKPICPIWPSFRRLSTSVCEIYSKFSRHELNFGEVITLSGWVKYLREFNTHTFLHLNDGLSPQHIQIVVPHNLNRNILGSAVRVTGELCRSVGPQQQFEVKAETFECVRENDCRAFTLNDAQSLSYEYIRNFVHLRPKTNIFSSILRSRDQCAWEIHKFLKSRHFVSVTPPILTTNDCEGGSNVFSVSAASLPQNGPPRPFFPHRVYLSVSAQFHLEAMMTSLSRVYSLGPAFRADYSDSSRHHLAEFCMLEVELAFVDHLEDLTRFVQILVSTVAGRMKEALQSSGAPVEKFVGVPYPIVTYDQAVEMLAGHEFNKAPKHGDDFSKEHELYLCEHLGGVPVFVVEFPANLKPFYVRRTTEGKALAFDLLGPGVGEIAGGSLRENDPDELARRMEGFDEETCRNLDWYVEIRKFGCPPHGGFGLGFERLIQAFLGVPNIRDTVPFPRYSHCCRY